MYNIVWIAQNKKRALRGTMAQCLKAVISECAQENQWRVDEIKMQGYQVRILINLLPDGRYE